MFYYVCDYLIIFCRREYNFPEKDSGHASRHPESESDGPTKESGLQVCECPIFGNNDNRR
jgi:hypothetical protein